MAKEPNPIVVGDFQKGIADSAFLGMAEMRNVDITSLQGAAQINFKTTKKTSTTVTGKPRYFAMDTIGQTIYMVDAGGVIYQSTNQGSSWSVLAGNTTGDPNVGLVVYKDYLFAFRAGAVDVYGGLATSKSVTMTIATPAVFTHVAHGLVAGDTVIFSTSGALPTGLTAGTVYYVIAAGLGADVFEVSTSAGGTAVNTSGSQSGTHTYKFWKNSWQTFSSSGEHPAVWGQDDILYWGSKNLIISVAEVSGQTFDPSTSATFTYNNAALTLPSRYRVNCLAELGVNLMIGTYTGSVYYVEKNADIFPWDRTSTSFRLPVRVKEFGINQMVTYNNRVYFIAGERGALYVTDGFSVQLLRELYKPMQYSATALVRMAPSAGAIMVHKNKIYVGVSNTVANAAVQGVWSYDPINNILNFEHQVSTDTVVSSNTVTIGCLFSIGNDAYLIGWQDDTTSAQGIDLVDVTARYTSYAARIDSQFFDCGTYLNLRTFSQIEIQLAKYLASGQGVQISYRKSLSDSFTLLQTIDFATYGAIDGINLPAPVTNANTIQLRVELTSTDSTSPILLSVMLR